MTKKNVEMTVSARKRTLMLIELIIVAGLCFGILFFGVTAMIYSLTQWVNS